MCQGAQAQIGDTKKERPEFLLRPLCTFNCVESSSVNLLAGADNASQAGVINAVIAMPEWLSTTDA
jgi:hypothetical protein